MTIKIGPNFEPELKAAGIENVGFTAEGRLLFSSEATDGDKAKANAVLAKHDPTKPGPASPVIVSGDTLIGSFTDEQADTVGMRDLARLSVRPFVSVGDDLVKRIAAALKTTPDALLAAAAS